MTTVVESPDDLVRRFVRPDAHVHLAATTARPNAAILALAQVFAGQRTLTVSTTAVYSSAHALALSGAVRRVISVTSIRHTGRMPCIGTCGTAGRSNSNCGRCSVWSSASWRVRWVCRTR